MQAVPDSDPAGRLIPNASGLYHYVFVLRFQGLLQLILKLVLSVLAIVDLMHNVTIRGGQGDPVNRKNRMKTTELKDRLFTHLAVRTGEKNARNEGSPSRSVTASVQQVAFSNQDSFHIS